MTVKVKLLEIDYPTISLNLIFKQKKLSIRFHEIVTLFLALSSNDKVVNF